MNKLLYFLCGLFFLASFVACTENDGEVDKYADWGIRNQEYLDSIAQVAKANYGTEVGQWQYFHTYKFDGPITGDINNAYVFCKILQKGEGATPLYSDSVMMNYRGMLINGEVFDQSYLGEFSTDFAVPVKFTVRDGANYLISGWTTALMNMKEGDRWLVYIPFNMGYGSAEQTNIPAYSTLIFDMHLSQVRPLKGKE